MFATISEVGMCTCTVPTSSGKHEDDEGAPTRFPSRCTSGERSTILESAVLQVGDYRCLEREKKKTERTDMGRETTLCVFCLYTEKNINIYREREI